MTNGNSNSFNAFPHIPAKAMDHKEGIKKILKRVQATNTQLKHQVRMGVNDLNIKVKYQHKDNYRQYVSVALYHFDPNDTVPDWDLTMRKKKVNKPDVATKNPFDWQRKAGKCGASQSPEDRRSKRGNRENINDWQIAEYLHAYLEGTTTVPKNTNMDWRAEAGNGDEEAIKWGIRAEDAAKEAAVVKKDAKPLEDAAAASV